MKWFRMAAENDELTAQFNVGVLYAEGKGVPKDYEKALDWYRIAAEQGFVPALYNLGLMYYHGYGVPQDHVTAYGWIDVAAQEGEENALAAKEDLLEILSPKQLREAKRLSKENLRRITGVIKATRESMENLFDLMEPPI